MGFANKGQSISIRGFTSDNAVPALSTYGTLCLLDAKLTGRGDAAKIPAIVNFNGGRIFLRDIATSGYGRALGDISHTPDPAAAFRITGADKPGSLGPDIGEYCSQPATSPFPSPPTSLHLPVKETPEVPRDDPKTWGNVDDFGADPTGKADSAVAIQKAMDSGATTVFLPGSYNMRAAGAAFPIATSRARPPRRARSGFLKMSSLTNCNSGNRSSGRGSSTSRTKERISPTMAVICGFSATRPNAAIYENVHCCLVELRLAGVRPKHRDGKGRWRAARPDHPIRSVDQIHGVR